jgi:hypothetical protein
MLLQTNRENRLLSLTYRKTDLLANVLRALCRPPSHYSLGIGRSTAQPTDEALERLLRVTSGDPKPLYLALARVVAKWETVQQWKQMLNYLDTIAATASKQRVR